VKRTLAIIILSLAALLAGAAPASAGPKDPMLDLVPSYLPPAGDPDGARLAGRGWTYDSAVVAAGLAASGKTRRAAQIVGQLAELQRQDGAVDFSYDLRSGQGDGFLRSGAVAWIGLAAVELRAATCSRRNDALMDGIAGWLLARRNGAGLVTGGPDVRWASTEHNLEARAFLAGLAALVTGRPAYDGARRCPAGLGRMGAAEARALGRRLDAAVATLDGAIDQHLFARDGGTAHFRQGLDDDARPLDVQALGIQWLLGQGRRDDALAVEAYTDATMVVTGRRVGGAGPFTGYRPYADAWGPDILWMEGTLIMRAAKRALGQDTAALDASADAWARLSPSGYLLQSDVGAVGNPAGDYRPWAHAAPAGWLMLSRSRSGLLR
jgi:hypothetical protein